MNPFRKVPGAHDKLLALKARGVKGVRMSVFEVCGTPSDWGPADAPVESAETWTYDFSRIGPGAQLNAIDGKKFCHFATVKFEKERVQDIKERFCSGHRMTRNSADNCLGFLKALRRR